MGRAPDNDEWEGKEDGRGKGEKQEWNIKILSLLSHSSIVRRNEGRETAGTGVRKASEELKNQDSKSLLDYIK